MCITLLVTTQVSTETFDNLFRLFIHSLRVECLILKLFPNLQSILQEFQESLGVSFGLVANLFAFHSLFHRSQLGFKQALVHSIWTLTGCDFFSFFERHFILHTSHLFNSLSRFWCL